MKTTFKRVLVLLLMLSFTVSMVNGFTPAGLMKKGGLPPGIKKRFIDIVEKKYSYETVIREINLVEKRIIIKDGTALIHFLVAEDAKIELNGKSSSLSQLRSGDEAFIKINSSNTVTEIKAKGKERVESQPTKITGVIKTLDIARKEIVVEGNNTTGLYKVEATTVYIDNKTSTISNLKVGMEVTVHVEGVHVKTIYAKSLPLTEIKATIKAVNETKREVVLLYDQKEELYVVKKDAIIKINGVTQKLSQIKVGSIVTVKVQSGQITELIINDGILQIEGRLMAKNTSSNPSVTLEINQELKVFNVKKDLDMAHINVGSQVIIYIKDNFVIAIQEK